MLVKISTLLRSLVARYATSLEDVKSLTTLIRNNMLKLESEPYDLILTKDMAGFPELKVIIPKFKDVEKITQDLMKKLDRRVKPHPKEPIETKGQSELLSSFIDLNSDIYRVLDAIDSIEEPRLRSEYEMGASIKAIKTDLDIVNKEFTNILRNRKKVEPSSKAPTTTTR